MITLEIVRIEDWTLYPVDGEPRIRDLDLAERAGLAESRKIRRVIRKAIDEGVLVVTTPGLGAPGPENTAKTWVVREATAGSVDPSQAADVYYLNEEAALLVIMRLRTKVAIQVQRAVVRVFLLAKSGAFVPPLAPVSPRLDAPVTYDVGSAIITGAEAAGLITNKESVVRLATLFRETTGYDLLKDPGVTFERSPVAEAIARTVPGGSITIINNIDTRDHYSAEALPVDEQRALYAALGELLQQHEAARAAE